MLLKIARSTQSVLELPSVIIRNHKCGTTPEYNTDNDGDDDNNSSGSSQNKTTFKVLTAIQSEQLEATIGTSTLSTNPVMNSEQTLCPKNQISSDGFRTRLFGASLHLQCPENLGTHMTGSSEASRVCRFESFVRATAQDSRGA